RAAGETAADADSTDDLGMVFGRRATRFVTPIRTDRGAFREGSGRPGGPRPGEPFRPSRALAAKREAFAGGARSGTFGRAFDGWEDDGAAADGGDGGEDAAAGPTTS